MSGAALICDTGALVDYLCASAPDHQAFRVAIDEAKTRYVPALVVAEVDYFLANQRTAMRAFLDDLRIGAFTYADATLPLLLRAGRIDQAYADLGLGLVDASIVALAELTGVTRLATRDIRHFAAVRLHDGRAFDLAVQPGRPDPGGPRSRRHRR